MLGGLSVIVNLGNTCYINSIIQCLSHNSSFRQDLMSFKENGMLMGEIIKLIKNLWLENCIIRPRSFKAKIDQKMVKYKGVDKNDASEFFIDLVNILQEETIKVTSKEVTLAPSPYSSKFYKMAEKNWVESLKQNTFITDNFYGQLERRFVCSDCENSFRKYEPFLSLDVGVAKDNLTVQDLLKNFFSKDYVYLECENCGSSEKDTEHEVTTEIIKLPSTLTLVFKNFNKYNIDADETLDMSGHTLLSDQTVFYKLRSLITFSNDHYISIIKKNKYWVMFDDTSLKKIHFSKLDTSKFYILFYSKAVVE